ncbi:MAG: protoporphyrinogen oxidase [Alphaproteobacteria bacterium]|nr:protoporphyrinogen oxidase [Alphaproteobacteria bacterium]
MPRDNIVIVGAGISGLAAAWFLHRKGFAVRVLEAGDRVGGVIDTETVDGHLIERGPNSTMQKPGTPDDALGRIVEQTGVAERLLEAAPAARKRFVMRGRRLMSLPGSPVEGITTKLFSWPAKLRLLAEPFIGRARDEETVARFVTRRLGREFLDYAIAPFISGVYAGDPEALSVRAAVAKIYALERDHGSLIRGAIALRKLGRGAGMPAGRLVSFDRGMAVLPAAIAEALPAGAVETRCRVDALVRDGDEWRVRYSGPDGAREIAARHVLLAVPAGATADLIEPLAPQASALLRAIPYAPIVSAGLGYARRQVGHPLDGFGFLIPRVEGVRTLGGLFSSTLFPGRAPDGRVLITAFIGGTMDPDAVALDDDAVAGQVGADLAAALAIDGAPSLVRLSRHRAAIPQYTIGHLDRIAGIDAQLTALPGLHLCASWRGGIAVGDCIRNAEKLAESLG